MSECCLRCRSIEVSCGFCAACSIAMIPNIYPCTRCGKPLSKSSYEFACEKCTTIEERQWLVDHWPEMKHKP